MFDWLIIFSYECVFIVCLIISFLLYYFLTDPIWEKEKEILTDE